jgi:hypothetical protein
MTVLVHCSFLEGVTFGEPGVQVLYCGGCIVAPRTEYHSGSFIFLVFLVVCIRTAIRVVRCCRG